MNRTELAAVWPPTAAVAAATGHKVISPTEAIRRKCLDCSAGQHHEVRQCELVTCALWPFRSGRHPYTRTRLQEALSGEPAPGGTQVPAEAAFSRNPALQASGEECGHSGGLAATASAAGTAAIAETRLQQAFLGEPAAGGTQVPAEGPSPEYAVLQASGGQGGAVCAERPEAKG